MGLVKLVPRRIVSRVPCKFKIECCQVRVLEFDIDPVVNLELGVSVEQIRSMNASIKKLEAA